MGGTAVVLDSPLPEALAILRCVAKSCAVVGWGIARAPRWLALMFCPSLCSRRASNGERENPDCSSCLRTSRLKPPSREPHGSPGKGDIGQTALLPIVVYPTLRNVKLRQVTLGVVRSRAVGRRSLCTLPRVGSGCPGSGGTVRRPDTTNIAISTTRLQYYPFTCAASMHMPVQRLPL